MIRAIHLLPLLLCAPAGAVTLTQLSSSTPWTGVTWLHYTTTSPKTHTWVARVDLCAARIHVNATKASSSLKTVSSWADDGGLQLAVNGDFYKTDPVRVYGAAVGDGIAWPVVQTGLDPAYASEWYYKDFGWVAFGPDWVDFTHSKLVKNTQSPTTGYKPGTVGPGAPPGTLALVSGFPEIVIDGTAVTCSSPTADTCFPDRSDMRARHPRTAIGLTSDKKTLILAVVDGRTSASIGMYGTELASLMKQLGAHVAFNLDGGGSSQFWVRGQGTVNDASGNNNGGGLRAVANHLGIFAGTSGMPPRPGHCATSPACGAIGPGGGVVDNKDPCFHVWGPIEFWRTEAAGYAGELRWTNATDGTTPYNWAWWQLSVDEPGEYRVEYHATAAYALFNKVHYDVRANGVTTKVIADQTGQNGWKSLGDFDFAAGKGQWVAVFDDAGGAVASGKRITADAIRLVRLDPWCGDAACNGGEGCGTCPADCGACPACGDGSCNGAETCGVCPGDCGACPPSCGDGACNGGEACGTCPADCGACPPVCGDGVCNGADSCAACPADCGACPPACGDGACNGDDSCATCPADCGACAAVCGDGSCSGGEGCVVCPQDCGGCPTVCGDGACNGGETCESCIADCGACEEPDVWQGDPEDAANGDAVAPDAVASPDAGPAGDTPAADTSEAHDADNTPVGAPDADTGPSDDSGAEGPGDEVPRHASDVDAPPGNGDVQVRVAFIQPDSGCAAGGPTAAPWVLVIALVLARRRGA